MVLTETDLTQIRAIKRPKTFNPLGGVVLGITLGIAHSNLSNYFVYSIGTILTVIIAIFLLLVSIVLIYITLSLTSKNIRFILLHERHKTFQSQFILNALLFYLGFTPLYGLAIVYASQRIPFPHFLIPIGVLLLIYSSILWFFAQYLHKEKVSMGYILDIKYQPYSWYLLLFSSLSVVLPTIIIFFL